MHQTTSSPDLHLLIAEADAAARRLHCKLGLPAADRDDLRQELLIDALLRLWHFDPERGSLGAFAGAVLRHHAMRLADRIMRERRRQGGPLLSRDLVTSGCMAFGETLSDAASSGDRGSRADQRLDLASVLTRIDRHQRTLCVGVALFSVDQLVAHGVGSRASLYRRLHDLRCTHRPRPPGGGVRRFGEPVSRGSSMNSITSTSTLRGLTETEFCAWIGHAEPGDILEYHHGFLALDASAGPLTPAEQKALRRLARRAFWASKQGLVHLVQQRRGPGSFRYLAVKRRRPSAARIAAAALVDCLVEAA